MLEDLRYGVRLLMRSPGFTAVAVLTLALGIGANTAIFSLVNAVLLRPLPFPQPDRLVAVNQVHRKGTGNGANCADFQDLRSRNTVFEEIALMGSAGPTLSGGGGDPERLRGLAVSAGTLRALGVRPVLGRDFLPGEDAYGAAPVVVLGHGFWRRRFGGGPEVVGRSLTLSGHPRTVVGVLPPGFRLLDEMIDVLMPLQMAGDRGSHQYSMLARLKPGTTLAAAQAETDAIMRGLEQEHPATNRNWTVRVLPLHEDMVAEARPALLLLMGAVAFVLLIACANVANLLLARAAGRSREMAVRAALGAGRWRLFRLALAESLLVSAAGAGAGLVLALWIKEAATAAVPRDVPLQALLEIDGYVLAFTAAVAVATGVLAGLAPAVEGWKARLSESIRQGARTRLLNSLVVADVSLALILVVGAGLLAANLMRLLSTGLGYRTGDVLAMNIALPSGYNAPRGAEFFERLLGRLRSIPGVADAAAIDTLPMGGAYQGGAFAVEGRPAPADRTEMSARMNVVTPDYFRTMGIALRSGRSFDSRDTAASEPVVAVSEALAGRYFPGEDPLAKRIRRGETWRRIVGVVGEVRHQGSAREVEPDMYFPFAQMPSSSMFVAVRTTVPPGSVAAAVRAEIRALEREALITKFRTMDEALGEYIAAPKATTLLVGAFAALALALAAMGLFGVLSYAVARRTHEIGIRMALGAGPGEIGGMVLARGLGLTATGTAIGLAGAYGVTRLLTGMIPGVASSPLVYAAAILVLGTTAIAACWLPARRAASLDPVETLRKE